MPRMITRQKRFATWFDVPIHYRLFRQSIAIGIDNADIISKGKSINFEVKYFDINGNFLSKNIIDYGYLAITGMYHFVLLENQIPELAKTLVAAIVDDTGYEIVQKTFDVADPCLTRQNFYLVWQNDLNGFDVFRFDNGFQEKNSTSNAKYLQEYGTKYEQIISHEGQKEIRLTAKNIPSNKIEGVASLFRARQVWLNDFAENYKLYRPYERDSYIPIIIKPQSIVVAEVRKNLFDVEFECILAKMGQ